jgi:hypothetical protein
MLTDSALKIIIILLWVGMLTAFGFHHTTEVTPHAEREHIQANH